MTLNLNIPLLDLEGKAITYADIDDRVITAGRLLSTLLISATKGDAIKFFDWATLLHRDSEINVDRSDLDIIKNFVKDAALPALQKAQILILLNRTYEEKK